MEVVPGKEVVSQRCLLLIDMTLKKTVRREIKLKKKLKLWRLRDSNVEEEFVEVFNNKYDGNEDWCDLEIKLLDLVSEVWLY